MYFIWEWNINSAPSKIFDSCKIALKLSFLTKIRPNGFNNLDHLCPKFCCENGLLKQYAIVLNKSCQDFGSDSVYQ